MRGRQLDHPTSVAGHEALRFLAAAGALLLAAATAQAAQPGVGERIALRIEELPAPYASESVANPSRFIERTARTTLEVADGFAVNYFAFGLENARWMTVAPNGDVFVAEAEPGRITVLRDSDGDGQADIAHAFAVNHRYPHGMVIRNGYLYIADLDNIWRYGYSDGQLRAAERPQAMLRSGALGGRGGHRTRTLAISPDGRRFYVAIGSRANIAEEDAPRATVQEFGLDGGGQRTFASGLRNPVGIAFRPGGDELYVVVNERDGLGDELVPDFLTRIEDGDFFGWPYAYLGANPQPGYGHRRPDEVARTKLPDVLFLSHSAPLGLVFYDASGFPAEYRGDAFVALHGSWNAASPRGYMIARVPFENGRPAGYYEVFATGFWESGEKTAEVWGRPAGLAVAADGSLLIADDIGGVIWRISYQR